MTVVVSHAGSSQAAKAGAAARTASAIREERRCRTRIGQSTATSTSEASDDGRCVR